MLEFNKEDRMLFTNEIVFRGHPDKVCDQISDAILDAYLEKDKTSRVAVEVMGGKSKIYVTGEVSSNASINIKEVVVRVLQDVGYELKQEIVVDISEQSGDIAQGVDGGGAGDNGIMFGYACNDTPEMLPTAVLILQDLSVWYDERRKEDNRFLADGKAQLTGEYENGELKRIKKLVICYQNTEKERATTDEIIRQTVAVICYKRGVGYPDEVLINPTGRFEKGGFEADTGLTGRKIVVDSYQGFARVGGGAFSGKDPTKVDRSGAYKARLIAKRLVQEHKLFWCEVQLAYSIGVEEPLGIVIFSNAGNIKADRDLYEECKPKNIIEDLKLKEMKFEPLARFGHFGGESGI